VIALEFSQDDRSIISSSEDGQLYEWVLGGSRHSHEYFVRQATCSMLRVSSASLILAYYEDNFQPLAQSSSRHSRRESSNHKSHRHIALFHNSIKTTPDSIIETTKRITSLIFCKVKLAISALDRVELLAVGYEDGSILISALPIPLRIIEMANGMSSDNISLRSSAVSLTDTSTTTNKDAPVNIVTSSGVFTTIIDVDQCRLIHIHHNSVTSLATSDCGSWLFSSGADGSIFMFATNFKAAQMSFTSEGTLENALVMTELDNLRELQQDSKRKKVQMDDFIYEKKKQFENLRAEKDQTIMALEQRLAREVSKRDTIIIGERDDHIKSLFKLHRERDDLRDLKDKNIAELEHDYEKKLARETMFALQSKIQLSSKCVIINLGVLIF
jgi:hypothetical protein